MSQIDAEGFLSMLDDAARLKRLTARELVTEASDRLPLLGPDCLLADEIIKRLRALAAHEIRQERVARRSPCCQRQRTHLIQGGHSAGGGEYTQESVYVCENCGQFRVSAMKNGVWTEVRFSIWNPDTLAAAGKPLERVAAEEAASQTPEVKH
jgi:hypothetical protein